MIFGAVALHLAVSMSQPVSGRLWCLDVNSGTAIIRTTGRNRRTFRVPIRPDRTFAFGMLPPFTAKRIRHQFDASHCSREIVRAIWYPWTGSLSLWQIGRNDFEPPSPEDLSDEFVEDPESD